MKSEKELIAKAASLFGKKGGSVKSEAKAKAARLNGLKGGRNKNAIKNKKELNHDTRISSDKK